MNITLRQLRAFLAVAELGQFNMAAQSLGLTQAAVSLLVRDLETELGVRLFDRHTRKVELTDIGAEFLPQARKTMDDLDLATRAVRERATLARGKVTIATSIVLAATTVPGLIAGFLEDHPGIEIELHDIPEEEIRPSLIRNEADIALGTMPDDHPEILATPVSQDRLVVTCRSNHRLAGRDRVSWTELRDEKIIVLAERNPLREIVERTMAGIAPNFRPAYAVRFSTTALGMVAAGLGITVLPENSGELASASPIDTAALVDPRITRDICLIQHRSRSLSPPAEALKQMILSHFDANRTSPSAKRA